MSTTTQHTGERYAPIVANPIEWDKNREYEYLTIVIYNGDSYISKQDVPKSVQITNTKYWLKTNNYRAQIDQAIEKSNEAISKATTATNLATSSLAKADEAKGKAEEASGKVNEAIGKADDAIGLATSGLAKADEAKGRAEEASGKANEAIAKADNALAKFPVSIANGGTGATTAAAARTNLGVTAANVVGNQAITPSSVTATGAVSGSTVSDSVGSLADLRDSVSQGKLKAANVSGKTEANGIFQLTDFKLGQRVVVGVISDDWYTAIPVAVGGWKNWMLQVFTLDHEKMGGQQVSFSILYYDS